MKLWAMIPELVLGGMCLVLVPVAGLVRGRWRVVPGVVAALGLLACMVLTARMLSWDAVAAMHGAYAVDGFGHVFKLLILAGAFISLLMCMAYFRGRSQLAHMPVALLFATLGAVALVSSMDLGLVVLFLQMMSMASYVLVALLRNDRRALEAAFKIFIYGAVALAVMAYGLTFFYGMSGSTDLREVGAAMGDADMVWVVMAIGLVLVGYGFEVTLVPFHPWAPDVYEGAAAPVSGFISVVPKVAGFAALLRFLLYALPEGVAAWPHIIAGGAVLTMTLGNLAALRQTRLKRLLAYSSIAHAGYVLMAVAVAGRVEYSLAAIGFYLGAYLLMNLGAFAVVAQLERALGSDDIATVRGLSRTAPGPALVLVLCLLSLAGIPPLVGFVGKVLLLGVAIDGGMSWLAVIAAVNMVIGLYYYLRVMAQVFFRRIGETAGLPAVVSMRLAYVITAVGVVGLGVAPAWGIEIMEMSGRLIR